MNVASGVDEQRRNGQRAAEQAMAKVGKESCAVLAQGARRARTMSHGVEHPAMRAHISDAIRVCWCAEAGRSPLVRELLDRFEEFVPGVSGMGLLNCFIPTLTTLLGPITVDFISSVRADGTQATWGQAAGDFYLYVAGPGQFKTGTMLVCNTALHIVMSAVKTLKASLGGTISVHTWVNHVDFDASVFRDGSTSAWFERIKGECPPTPAPPRTLPRASASHFARAVGVFAMPSQPIQRS